MKTSIYWQIFEDDKTCSALWQDLRYVIRDTATYSNLTITIHYHSKKAYGSYHIDISNGSCTIKPLEAQGLNRRYPVHSEVEKDLIKLLTNYSPSDRNLLVLSGHMNIYFKTDKWLSTDVFKNMSRDVYFDLMVIDSCTSSYWPWLLACQTKCDYLLGCESTSPYLGFIGKDFFTILMKEFYGSTSKKTVAKHFIDSFIKRNEKVLDPYLVGRCDASMIDMKQFRFFVSNYKSQCERLIRYAQKHPREFVKARLEFKKWYPLYDLVGMLEISPSKNDNDIAPELEKCVLYVKINKEQRKFLQQHDKTASAYRGISTFVLH